ncbi:anaphase-promoting complex APC subunit 1-domain-containing protein [Hyaloscypha finlandica]|nr:anaphase-promoting complex APC subunit 1-domain-containing protein [Hyaloscypha sp. PMI_1271]KAH8793167.1 anaphase-promoting complex APC subunit 1-domain-containing protein [Hyaloscypha finlandica]
MLRRKPTSITLTTEDVAIYEDSRARENHLREQAVLQAQMQAQGTPQKKTQNIRDPNDELRPLPGDRARAQHVKTRDERLGLMGGGGGRRADTVMRETGHKRSTTSSSADLNYAEDLARFFTLHAPRVRRIYCGQRCRMSMSPPLEIQGFIVTFLCTITIPTAK